MVFFTCNECGQSVKKNQVDNHRYYQCKCRNCQSFSCMDCGKEFWGDDYKEHTKCVSEDQKYGGKDYKPKPSSNKGEVKQEKWIEHIQSIMEKQYVSGPLSGLLGQVIQYPNIPRKQSKFENFLKNSLNVRSQKLIGEAWQMFAGSIKNDSNDSAKPSVNGTSSVNELTPMNGSQTNNGASPNTLSSKRPADFEDKVSNKKAHSVTSSSSKGIKNKSGSFDWCEACKKILQDFPSGIPAKKLRKRVVAEYKASLGGSCNLKNSELKRIFKSELSNNPIFSVYVDPSRQPVS